MLLTHHDLRHGIPLNAVTQTQSMGEMRVLKQEETLSTSWMRTPDAIHVVDRAFVDGHFGDQHLKRYGSTIVNPTKRAVSSIKRSTAFSRLHIV